MDLQGILRTTWRVAKNINCSSVIIKSALLPPCKPLLYSTIGFTIDHYSQLFLHSLLLSSWYAVRSYRFHLEVRDPIWGDDCSHSPFNRRFPSWGFQGFSSDVRQMRGDLCTAPEIISSSPLSLATDVIDVTLGASGLCLGTRTGAGGTATLA